jgi:alginate O-acetyltransferase complex protein AlgJ
MFIPLGSLRGVLGPPPDRIEETVTVDISGGGGDLFGGLDIPAALVGTSYSASGVWDFDGALKVALGVDVLKVAAEGRGPFVPMREYLDSPTIDNPKPRVVIWEIPERYLGVDVPLGIGSLSVTKR